MTNVNYFEDDDGDIHEVNINAIAAEGIVRGTGTNADNEALYSPGRRVPRDQMASFLANKLDRLLQDTNTAVPGDVELPPVATVTPTTATVAKGSTYSGTVTAQRATIDFVTVSGCGALTTLRFPTVASPGSATQAISVPILLTQPNGPCTLTVVTNFTDIDDVLDDDHDADVVAGEAHPEHVTKSPLLRWRGLRRVRPSVQAAGRLPTPSPAMACGDGGARSPAIWLGR